MSDPLATSFDSLVGALAAARIRVGRPIERDAALVATGRAFRLSVDEHLRVVPPSPAEVAASLAALGFVGEATGSGDALRAHDGIVLLWGVGGDVFGLAHREGDELVAVSALAPAGVRVAIGRIAGAKLLAVLLRSLSEPAAVVPASVAREELARPPAYREWSRALATHPFSRLDPAGHAWTLARVDEALHAAASAVADPDLERERALVRELRALAPLPEGGSLSAESNERGAALLAEAAEVRARWLARLAASS